MRYSIIIFSVLLLFLHFPAFAQETQPGASCTVEEAGRYRLSGGPDLAGEGYLLTCYNGQWRKIFGFSANGIFHPQFANDLSCNDGNLLVFDAATNGLRCSAACSDHTPNSYNLIDQSNADIASTVTSNIVRITGINCIVSASISGEGSPQYRICTDVACSAGNILQDWTNGSSPLSENQYVQMRLTTSPAGGDTHTAHLIIGSGVEVWNVTTAGDCDAPDPAIGTICADGTVYAGLSPDGYKKMYTARCDAGQTWTGMLCAGTRILLSWNDGNSDEDGYVLANLSNGNTGRTNTSVLSGLDSDSKTDGFQPHQAATYCAQSTAHGKNDWYLPALNEMMQIVDHRELMGISGSAAYYWVSTEYNRQQNLLVHNINASSVNIHKHRTGYFIRCVRRDD